MADIYNPFREGDVGVRTDISLEWASELLDKSLEPTPYDIVGDIIQKYWSDNEYEDLLVWIKQSYGKEHKQEAIVPVVATMLLEPITTVTYSFYWWQGQDNVELVGLIPLSEIKIDNYYTEYNQVICEVSDETN